MLRHTRTERKNYCDLAPAVWREVGDRELCMNSGDESIRGALAFYGKRELVMIPGRKMLLDSMKAPRGAAGGRERAFFFVDSHFELLRRHRDFAELLAEYREIRPDFPDKADSFVLLIPRGPAR